MASQTRGGGACNRTDNFFGWSAIVPSTVKELLRQQEGLRLKPYKDAPGHFSIGYGRNLDAKGISRAEAETMLDNDITEARADCTKYIPRFAALDEVRQAVLVSMAINNGLTGLMLYQKMLLALASGDYKQAAAEIIDSAAARAIPGRYKDLAQMMETGEWLV